MIRYWTQPDRLGEVFYAVSQIIYCDECDRSGKKDSPLGALIGVMDWVSELHRLVEGGKLAMEDPNKRQVGGHHYKLSEYQHWDFVADNGLNYFEAQVTKYVARWRNKNGKQDLEKAQHYLAKLISLYTEGRLPLPFDPGRKNLKNFDRFRQVYELSGVEQEICYITTTYWNPDELLRVRDLLARLIEEANRVAAALRGGYSGNRRFRP